MTAAKKSVKGSSGVNEVDAFMRKLNHPLKAEVKMKFTQLPRQKAVTEKCMAEK